MSTEEEINIFRCLDFLRDNAHAYAKAKAERIYLEEFRKTKKALCMRHAESSGVNAISAQERDAYADPDYIKLLEGIKSAVEEEEKLRWLLIGAQAKIAVFQTLSANKRVENKVIP